ncbi:hypothetical protein AB1K56_11790 [Microbacterium sp. BWR-S6Y]|uniref:hypothetical protein n=1 Tax=Microbacterium sp. BWR-S6Y TaxID=3232073 RepID=UPI0035282DE6
MDDSAVAFPEVMNPVRRVVASGTFDAVEWNAELIRGDVMDAVQWLNEQPGRGIARGGVKLSATRAAQGFTDELTFVVHPGDYGAGTAVARWGRPEARAHRAARIRSSEMMQRYRPAA